MAEKWVSKIEATTLFKVTERTLDNWVKAGKIQKARKNGQIMYEISSAMEEKQIDETVFYQEEPAAQTFQAKEEPVNTGPNEEERVLAVRIEEKMVQIADLRETLEVTKKDMNTLILERGQLTEQSKLLTAEAESLRKEKEILQNDFRNIAEKSISKAGVFIFAVTVFLLVGGIIASLYWKYFEEKENMTNQISTLEEERNSANSKAEKEQKEKLQKIEEMRVKKEVTITEMGKKHQAEKAELQQNEKKLYENLIETNRKNATLETKASEAEKKVSEQSETISEFQKTTESLQKEIEKLKNENSTLQLELKVEQIKNENPSKHKAVRKPKPTEADKRRIVKDSEEE